MKTRTPRETEYKFILPNPGADNAILKSLQSLGCEVQPQRTINQEDIYLDTFDWRLFRRNVLLRLRRTGGKSFYTLKSIGKMEGGLAERREIECEATGKIKESWNIVSQEIAAEIAEIIYPRRLVEHISIRTRRLASTITCPDGTEVEMVFDAAGFQAAGLDRSHVARLFEIEIELKKGAPEALDALAKNIAETFSLVPSPHSKLETAIERLGISFPAKTPPAELVVRADDRLDIAVKKILAFQLHRLQEHVPGTIADIDTEFVHQARVATRKMRSLLRLCADAVPKRSADYFAGELLWLGSIFGCVRDLDVFSLNLSKFKTDINFAPNRPMEILLRQIQEERAGVLADLKEGLASTRWRIFSLRLSTFTTRKPAIHPLAPLALATVAETSPAIIAGLFNKAIAQGARVLLKPKLENFHKLRIQFKKLRYAAEFFNPAFEDRLSPFIAAVTKMQDCLGELQDTVFTKELIVGLMKKWKGSVMDPRLIFILGEIYQLQEEISRARQSEFVEIWKQFDSENTRRKLAGTIGILSNESEA
jgi:inorganic triphosphatase YgiF